jgi:hypothetical protein
VGGILACTIFRRSQLGAMCLTAPALASGRSWIGWSLLRQLTCAEGLGSANFELLFSRENLEMCLQRQRSIGIAFHRGHPPTTDV